MAEEILLARPSGDVDQGALWYLYERNNQHQQMAEATSKAFFGVNIECAQCHDHPSAGEIEQKHYWGLVAFFRRSKNVFTKNGPRLSESAVGGFEDYVDLTGDSYPNLLTFLEATTIDEPRSETDKERKDNDELYVPSKQDGDPRLPRFSRRERFVKEIVVGHDRLARSFVNRTWAQFFGRGIVHPFDQMDSMHDPSHPELLDWLSKDFRASGYDVRRLVRSLVLSKAYRLAATPPLAESDPATFTWFQARPLTAEQYLRSVEQLMRAGQPSDRGLMQSFRKEFPDVGFSDANTTVTQTLFLSNAEALNQYLQQSTADGQLISQLTKLKPDEAVVLVFRSAYAREPTAAESKRILEFVSQRTDRKSLAWSDVCWALIASAEFSFNH